MKKGAVKSVEEFQMSELHIHEPRAPVALLQGLPADPASVLGRMAMKNARGPRRLFAYKHICSIRMRCTIDAHIRIHITYLYMKEASGERTHKRIAGVDTQPASFLRGLPARAKVLLGPADAH